MPSSGHKCSFCFNRFLTVPEWASHVIHEIEYYNITDCMSCSDRFDNCYALMKHVINRLCQTKIPRYVCISCNKRTNNAARLTWHEMHECCLNIDQDACKQLFTKSQCDELDNLWKLHTV